MRLFVAAVVPAPVVTVLSDLPRPPAAPVRWTTPAQWHVTLRFVGSVGDHRALSAALAGLPGILGAKGVTSVRAELGPATQWFPGRRVLQVPVVGLDDLAAAVSQATRGWCSPPAEPYRGHLTVARARGHGPGPAALAGSRLSATWPVEAVVLYSSTPSPTGPRYETLEQVALARHEHPR
ncbi:MAG TPA: hypothetical protein VMV14_00395 [Acidimicrobiales bacterium]|nr:hypothetical protein [Acidimicrobiales bacterium]